MAHLESGWRSRLRRAEAERVRLERISEEEAEVERKRSDALKEEEPW